MPAERHDDEPSEPEWAALSASAAKRRLFVEDLSFREGWARMRRLWGGASSQVLGPLAVLSLKPDAVVGRRMRVAVDLVTAEGYQPVACRPVRLTRHSMREVWRYDWNCFSVDRLALSTRLYTPTDSLVLLLRDAGYDGVVPASVRLSDLKPELRRRLDAPNPGIVNFVHTADEPADVIRELAILFDERDLTELLVAAGARSVTSDPIHDEVTEQIESLERRHAPHDLDAHRGLARLARRAGATGREERLERLDEAVRQGDTLSWAEVCEAVPPDDASVDIWDLVSVAAAVLAVDRPGHAELLPGPGPERWRTSKPGQPSTKVVSKSASTSSLIGL